VKWLMGQELGRGRGGGRWSEIERTFGESGEDWRLALVIYNCLLYFGMKDNMHNTKTRREMAWWEFQAMI
jgi:hypothetical protein